MDLSEFVKKAPVRKRGATLKQREFAEKIAYMLDLDLPDFSDFGETSEFISANMDDYNESIRDGGRWK